MDAPFPKLLPAEPRRHGESTRRRLWILAAGVVVATAIGIAYTSFFAGSASGLPDAEIVAPMVQPLANADKLTLYSIDGSDFIFASQKPSPEGAFYGCPVLGKVEIADQRKQKAIVDAIQVGIRGARSSASCFWPHHAIRAEKDGETVDYIICFKCSNFRKYSGESEIVGGATTNAAEKLLNRYFTDAGIPIAK